MSSDRNSKAVFDEMEDYIQLEEFLKKLTDPNKAIFDEVDEDYFHTEQILKKFGWTILPDYVDITLMENCLMDEQGVVKDMSSLRHLMFCCNLNQQVKEILWSLALGVYPNTSTTRERNYMRMVYKYQYQELKEKWKKIVSPEDCDPDYLPLGDCDEETVETPSFTSRLAEFVAKDAADREDIVTEKELFKIIHQIDMDINRTSPANSIFCKTEEFRKTARTVMITALAFEPLDFSQSDVEVLMMILLNIGSPAMSHWIFIHYLQSINDRFHQPCLCVKGPCHYMCNFADTRHTLYCQILRSADLDMREMMNTGRHESALALGNSSLLTHFQSQFIGKETEASQYFQMLISGYVEECLFHEMMAKFTLENDVCAAFYLPVEEKLTFSLDLFSVAAVLLRPKDLLLSDSISNFCHILQSGQMWTLQGLTKSACQVMQVFVKDISRDSYSVINMEDLTDLTPMTKPKKFVLPTFRQLLQYFLNIIL